MCPRWRSDWRNFLADMGEKPPGRSIERINNDDGYEPSNCRWATPAEQTRNRRSVKLTRDSLIEILRLEATGLPIGEIARKVRMGPNLTGATITTAKLVREIDYSSSGNAPARPGH